MNLDFNDSVLMISARSPFARRVRIAFHENAVGFQEKILDVYKPNEELNRLNPLGRVPTLILKSGEVLIDSSQILQAFYQSGRALLPGFPTTGSMYWSAIATGICDHVIAYFFETTQPEAHRDPEILAEAHGAIERSLESFEAFIGKRAAIDRSGLSQADWDMGTALAYISLRYPLQWRDQFPYAAKYFEYLSRRPSFEKTIPPPV